MPHYPIISVYVLLDGKESYALNMTFVEVTHVDKMGNVNHYLTTTVASVIQVSQDQTARLTSMSVDCSDDPVVIEDVV
jgi:hypothetical protein